MDSNDLRRYFASAERNRLRLNAKPKRAARPQHHPSILAGIASGPWCDIWATEQEEKGVSFSGMRIDDLAPPAPRWARRWAKKLADAIVAANGGCSLASLYERAQAAGYSNDAAHFGYHLGMQSVGHGVSFSDDCLPGSHNLITIPHSEFYRGVER